MDAGRVFVTGGGSGLGRALALRYARSGWRVCIGDLDDAHCADTLAELRHADGRAHAMPCDVTREEDLESAAFWLRTAWGGVDLVINNAGVAVAGGIADVALDDWRFILDVNLLGVVRGCRVFAREFRAQGHGHLVNVASLAGLIHPPMMAPYNAAKAAVVALSETLHTELAPDRIRVSVACPAFFRTNLARSARAATPDVERTTRRLVERAAFGADEVAERIVRGIARGDFLILTHRSASLAWWVKRYAPFAVYSRAMRVRSRALVAPKENG